MVTLIQKEETYEVTDESGDNYTVTIVTDIPNLYIEYDIFNDDGDEVTDSDQILHLISLIENSIA